MYTAWSSLTFRIWIKWHFFGAPSWSSWLVATSLQVAGPSLSPTVLCFSLCQFLLPLLSYIYCFLNSALECGLSVRLRTASTSVTDTILLRVVQLYYGWNQISFEWMGSGRQVFGRLFFIVKLLWIITKQSPRLLFPLDAQSCKVLKVKSRRQKNIVDIVFQ